MLLIINILVFLIGSYWFITGVTTFNFWKNISIGAGFIPNVISVIIMLIVLPEIFKDIKKYQKDSASFKKSFSVIKRKEFIPVAVVIVVMIATNIFGLLITMALMLFIWLKWISKYNVKVSLFTTILTMALICGIFKVWLKLPLPSGLLGII